LQAICDDFSAVSGEDEEREDPSAERDVPDEAAAMEYAAEEPTAMWNEDALRMAGLDHEQEQSAPATKGAGRGEASVRITTQQPDPRDVPMTPTPAKRSGGLSWGVTLGLAIALGLGVYFAIRALKG